MLWLVRYKQARHIGKSKEFRYNAQSRFSLNIVSFYEIMNHGQTDLYASIFNGGPSGQFLGSG